MRGEINFAVGFMMSTLIPLGMAVILALVQGPAAVGEVNFTASKEGLNVTITMIKGEGIGVFLVYGPSYDFYGKYGSERHTTVGQCNGTRSDQLQLRPGATVTCAFPAELVGGLQYVYKLYVILPNGAVYELHRRVAYAPR